MNHDEQLSQEAVGYEKRVDLAQITPADVFVSELRQVVITGKLTNYVVPNRCNFIASRLVHFLTDGVDFSRCDFKDNAILSCKFKRTRFRNLSFTLNTVQGCQFQSCKFGDTVLQNCEFYDTEFTACDFKNLVIKDCTFNRCRFTQCRTSNKLFEMCLLTECGFAQTELQVQTIEENFGLCETQLEQPLRSDRTDHVHETLSREQLRERLRIERQPLARLGLHYFLVGDLLAGSAHLDAALDVAYWVRTQATQGSFTTNLARLCEFLLWLHDRNELAYLPLVQLHQVTGALAEAVPAVARTRQTEFAAYGAHLSLARQIDPLVQLLSEWRGSQRRTLTLLVQGKHTHEFYHNQLAEMFARGNPRIVSLVPHNSPWEMALSFPHGGAVSAFIALFFSTRTQIELQTMRRGPPDSGQRIKYSKLRRKIAALTIGGGQRTKVKPVLHLNANLTANLVADFKLSVSTQCVGRIRKLLLGLLK